MLSKDSFLLENKGQLICTFNNYIEENSYC